MEDEMRSGIGLVIAATVAALSVPQIAKADEQMMPLAISGEWAAVAHHASMTEPPDVCLVMNLKAGFAIRSDGETVQIRVSNDSWSLPTSVHGAIAVAVGNVKLSFDINDNTNTMVNADMEPSEYQPLFDGMDAASSMLVTVGKAAPFSVSLVGSSKATNAFKTCARISGGSSKGGQNPFE
jgi:hypothetical protein